MGRPPAPGHRSRRRAVHQPETPGLRLTAAVCAYLVLVNALAWLLFAADKARARRGQRRVRESTLILFALAGGAPAALAAQILLRHKTRKQPFRSGLPILAGLWLAAVLVGGYGALIRVPGY